MLFFSLTFALTWTSWIAAVLVVREAGSGGALRSAVTTLLVVLGIVAPAIVALGLTARSDGREGLSALLRRLVEWRVPARWYVFAVGYMVAVKLTAAVAYRIVGGTWPLFGSETWYLMLAATGFSTVIGGQAGEELGWRGYALPRLEALWGLGPASLVLGIIWAAWHLPLFYMPGADTYGQSFPLYLVQVTGLSVAIGWLYGNTGRSLLLVMLMHAGLNNMAGIVPGVARPATNPFVLEAPLLGWLTAGVIWMAATYFLLRMRKASQRR
ncbi:MAG: type II CAAX endopeptidase family protein [Longimicrobiales bacterium]|nr:type II CAAX endopeptidase family protein [Longimicrobiales bacterium]